MPSKKEQRYRRHKRVRSKIKGTAKIPRLCVFRSNKHIYAQLIDDEKGETLVSASDLDIGKKPATTETQKKQKRRDSAISRRAKGEFRDSAVTGKALIAYKVGQILAKKALDKKFKKVVFDRGGYKYHGRVQALAEGAREGGLKF